MRAAHRSQIVSSYFFAAQLAWTLPLAPAVLASASVRWMLGQLASWLGAGLAWSLASLLYMQHVLCLLPSLCQRCMLALASSAAVSRLVTNTQHLNTASSSPGQAEHMTNLPCAHHLLLKSKTLHACALATCLQVDQARCSAARLQFTHSPRTINTSLHFGAVLPGTAPHVDHE